MILDVAPAELLILGAVALVVIPPKDLPKALRLAGQWVGRARGLARQFRSGFDDLIRESEFQEMEKKWKAENERIMREFPQTDDAAAVPPPPVEADPAPMLVAEPVIHPDPEPAPVAAPPAPPVPKKPRAKPRPKAKTGANNAGIEPL